MPIIGLKINVGSMKRLKFRACIEKLGFRLSGNSKEVSNYMFGKIRPISDDDSFITEIENKIDEDFIIAELGRRKKIQEMRVLEEKLFELIDDNLTKIFPDTYSHSNFQIAATVSY